MGMEEARRRPPSANEKEGETRTEDARPNFRKKVGNIRGPARRSGKREESRTEKSKLEKKKRKDAAKLGGETNGPAFDTKNGGVRKTSNRDEISVFEGN